MPLPIVAVKRLHVFEYPKPLTWFVTATLRVASRAVRRGAGCERQGKNDAARCLACINIIKVACVYGARQLM